MSIAALAQSAVFTYQGKLNDGGTSAIATCDIQFKLFDTATVGTDLQRGAVLCIKTSWIKHIDGLLRLAQLCNLENLEKISAVLKTFRTPLANDESRRQQSQFRDMISYPAGFLSRLIG
jgi:hypothetical protein